MAKKRLTDVPSAKAVKQLLAQKKFDLAAAEARKLVGFMPDAASTELLREVLFALAEAAVERKQFADFNRATQELEPLCIAAGAESIRALARLNLRGLQPGEVLRLIGTLSDADLAADLRGDLADYFVRTRLTASLPEDWKPAFTALQTALQLYDAKKDDDAREALNAIGLGSPFLEWKLWLRGLLAWGAEDTGRALENWSRLNSKRLPYQLAAPLRAQVDASWLADQPALREQLHAQYRRLGSSGLAVQLRNLRPELAARTGLAKPLKMAEGIVPRLKETHPALLPRLMNVFYHTMLKRAEPDDLGRFVKAFGRMPDDPNFFKLSGQIYDGVDAPVPALNMWRQYAEWLRDAAPWPPLLKKQAIAIVYRIMARIAARIDDFEPDVDDFFAPPKKAKPKKPKEPAPKPSEYLLKALEFAPDWEQAAADLMAAYDDEENTTAAAAFAEKYLAANPNASTVSMAYVELLMERGDFVGALVQLAPLRKTSPFDKAIRRTATTCILYCIYRFAMESEWDVPETMLDAERELLDSEAPVMTMHLRYAFYKKLKRTADAEAEFQKLNPTNLQQSFLILANAQIFKAKPAEKSAASKAYKAALAANMNAAEVLTLFASYMFFRVGEIEFTGLKAMQKGILDGMLASSDDPSLTEDQAVDLLAALAPFTAFPKMEKFAAAMGKRFPKHPIFPLCIVEIWAEKHPTGRPPYKIINLLRKAKSLVQNTTEPKYKELEGRIDTLNQQLDPFSTLRNMFDSFF